MLCSPSCNKTTLFLFDPPLFAMTSFMEKKFIFYFICVCSLENIFFKRTHCFKLVSKCAKKYIFFKYSYNYFPLHYLSPKLSQCLLFHERILTCNKAEKTHSFKLASNQKSFMLHYLSSSLFSV